MKKRFDINFSIISLLTFRSTVLSDLPYLIFSFPYSLLSTSHWILIISLFSPLTSHFSELTSHHTCHCSFSTAHSLLLSLQCTVLTHHVSISHSFYAHCSLFTVQCYFCFLTVFFSMITGHPWLLTQCFLLQTSHAFLLGFLVFYFFPFSMLTSHFWFIDTHFWLPSTAHSSLFNVFFSICTAHCLLLTHLSPLNFICSLLIT